MAKRTDEMKTYEDTKGDLEKQLRQEIAERRQTLYQSPSERSPAFLGNSDISEFRGSSGYDNYHTSTNAYDESGKYLPREERSEYLDYTIRVPKSTSGNPQDLDDVGFTVETPASAYPTIQKVHEEALRGSTPRNELIQALRAAGVSMPDFSDEGGVDEIYFFTDRLLRQPGVAGDATQAGKQQAQSARENTAKK